MIAVALTDNPNPAWARYLPQMASILILAACFYHLLPAGQKRAYIYYTVVSYLTYTISANLLITVHHRRGVRALRHGHYAAAIDRFRKSRQFFERHAWIDRYRAMVLMSAAAMSYREMAMTHIAIAYLHLGNTGQAIQAARQVLQDYPGNLMARRIAGLRDGGAGEQQPET